MKTKNANIAELLQQGENSSIEFKEKSFQD